MAARRACCWIESEGEEAEGVDEDSEEKGDASDEEGSRDEEGEENDDEGIVGSKIAVNSVIVNRRKSAMK